MGLAPSRELIDRQHGRKGPFAWVGSDYVTIREEVEPDTYGLHVLPLDESDCTKPIEGLLEGSHPAWDRKLAHITVGGKCDATAYRPDRIERQGENAAYSVVVPWGLAAVVLPGAPLTSIAISGKVHRESRNRLLITAGRWLVTVEVDGRGKLTFSGQGHELIVEARGDIVLNVAPAVGPEPSESRLRASGISEALSNSAGKWAAYLDSCPLVGVEALRQLGLIDDSIDVDAQDFTARQLWHWWAARANVVKSLSDPELVYVAPDRARWYGAWSSDAPITIAALAMTNERDLAVTVLLRYLRTSIDHRGRLSWYTHPDGRRGLLSLGDTGVLSEGVAEIVRVVDLLDRMQPGVSRMTVADGKDVFQWVERYLFESDGRDVNGDGLWETSHLWESGWDNKIGPMFEAAPMSQWVRAMASDDPNTVAAFLKRHSRPVTSLVEQASHLRGLLALAALADRRGSADVSTWANARSAQVARVVHDRHWDRRSAIYRDWDVKAEGLVDAECLDAFYLLEFETDEDRRSNLIHALRDDARFGLPYPPTLARSHPMFNPNGYWDGSYWPREMAYLAHALSAAGCHQDAARVLIAALLSSSGSRVMEHLNPDTLAPIEFHANGGIVYSQAMSVGLCIALVDLVYGDVWTREKEQHD